MIEKNHNYIISLINAHFALKKIAMTKKIKSEIFRTLRVQISFDRIIFNFCVFDSMIEISFIDLSNFETINFTFSFRDIYNLKTQFRRKNLRFLIFIQTLIRKFDQKN